MARETPWCTEAACSCGFPYSLQYTKSQQEREEKSGTELGGGFLRLKRVLAVMEICRYPFILRNR